LPASLRPEEVQADDPIISVAIPEDVVSARQMNVWDLARMEEHPLVLLSPSGQDISAIFRLQRNDPDGPP
jgi:hypothetical protein